MKLTLKIREPDHAWQRPQHKLYNVERNEQGEVMACYVGSDVPRLQGETKSIVFALFVEFERLTNGIKISRARGRHDFIDTLERRLDEALHDVIPHNRGEISFVAIDSEYYNNRIS